MRQDSFQKIYIGVSSFYFCATMKKPLWFVIFLIFISVLNVASISADSIRENRVTISSDKSIYYCEPIYNEKGECLIRAQITVTNENPDTSFNIYNSYSTEVQKEPVKIEALATISESRSAPLKTEEIKSMLLVTDKPMEIDLKAGSLIETDQKILDPKAEPIAEEDLIKITPLERVAPQEILILKENQPKIFYLEFWAKESGKFDVQLTTDKNGIIILDPLYSITVASTNPSWFLNTADIDVALDENDYLTKTNITSIISDNNTATGVWIMAGNKLYPNTMRFYYRFNNPFLSNIVDDNGGENDMVRLATTNISRQQDFYAMGINTATNGGAMVVSNSNLTLPASSFTYCATWNSTATLVAGTEYHIMSVSNPVEATSYEMVLSRSGANNRVGCEMRDDNDGGTFRNAVANMVTINNASVHTICCRRNIPNNTMQTIVDGIPIASVANCDSSITTNGNLVVSGWQAVGNAGAIGYIDELALWTTALTYSEANQTTFYNNSNGSAVQVNFNYSMKPATQYSLKIAMNASSPTVLRVYSMINSTHMNTTNFVEQSVTSGENYIVVDSIIYTGYNLPFRIITSKVKPIFISGIALIETANDTVAPNIYSCFVNDTFVDCDDGVEWGCNIYDNESAVSTAYGIVSFGGYFPILRQAYLDPINLTKWSVKLTASEIYSLLLAQGWTFNTNVSTYLSFANATDLAGNMAFNVTSAPTSMYVCVINCTENWVLDPNPCLTNDTIFISYTDLNACNSTLALPSDNGTYGVCNYCSENLIAYPSGDCVLGTQNVTWADANYFSCCALTGLLSDCNILYSPYNETTTQNCTFTFNQFDVDYDANAFYGFTNTKVYWKINLNSTANYTCLTYVKTLDGNLVQTNPVYTQRSDALLQIGAEYEDRQYFPTYNGIANVYFTKENIVVDGRDYIFGVECSSGATTLISERLITVGYRSLNEPVTRYFWLGNNIVPIILGILFVIAIAIFIGFIIRKVKYG